MGAAFEGCIQLQEFTIPEGVETLGMNCFNECDNLKKVVIPSTMKSIGQYCFEDCPLKEIYCKAVTPPDLEWYSTFNQLREDTVVYVPRESVALYKEKWTEYDDYIVGYDFE